MPGKERQRFAGERVTHDVLSLNPRGLFQIYQELGINPLGVLMIRGEHLARYDFVFQGFEMEGRRVLDIACGIGYGWHRNGKGAFIVGADIDFNTVREAEECYGKESYDFINADGVNLPFSDGSFDLIACFETIEHIKEPGFFLQEMSRVLDDTGILVISTPNRDAFNPGGSCRDRPANRFHQFELNLNELSGLLGGFFREISIYGQGQVSISPTLREKILNYGHWGKVYRLLKYLTPTGSLIKVKPLKEESPPSYLVIVCQKKQNGF